jgi:hypothetical protein
MKRIFILVAFVSLLVFTGCNKEEEGTLELRFNSKFNGLPLQLNTPYPFQNGLIEFTMVQYYVSNLAVEDKDGTSNIPLKDVDLINASSNNVLNYQLPAGAYKNVRIGLGLDEVMGASEPSSFGTQHPLSLNQNNYWMMTQSYIFVKIEGFFTINGQRLPLVYHLGDESFYRTIQTSSKAFSIHDENITTVTVNFNVNGVFNGVNLPQQDNTHTTNDFPLALQMMNNFAASFTIL